MKKIVAIAILSLSYILVNGQIEKKTVFLGATSSLSILDVKTGPNSSSTFFNISPQVGYFFVDNFMAGLTLSVTSNNGTSTSIGVFSRYYVQGKFFLGANYLTTSFSGGGSSFGQFGLEGGYAAFLNKNITLEPALVYSKGLGDYSNFGNFGLRVGFGLYINRK